MKRRVDGKPKQQDEYITQYMHLMMSVGITLAERVIQVIRHFFSAPPLQIVGYILILLQDEGIGLYHRTIIMNMVRLKNRLTRCTSHEVAMNIAKKQCDIPRYCLSYEGQCCLVCNSKLQR